jgi:hypothetical protein
MRAFSKEIIEKIKSLPDDERAKVVDGLIKLYSVRAHRASEDFKENGSLATGVIAKDARAAFEPER